MQEREFTVGDRLNSLSAYLYRPNGDPVVLGALDTVTFRMTTLAGVVKINNQAAVVVSLGSVATNSPAQVRYDWASADVDTAGTYAAWFIRTASGQTEHFPNQDYDAPEFQIVFRADS